MVVCVAMVPCYTKMSDFIIVQNKLDEFQYGLLTYRR